MTTSVFFLGGIANGCNLDGVLQCWSQSSIAKVLEKFSSEASLRTLNAQYAVEEYCRLVPSKDYHVCGLHASNEARDLKTHKLVRFYNRNIRYAVNVEKHCLHIIF